MDVYRFSIVLPLLAWGCSAPDDGPEPAPVDDTAQGVELVPASVEASGVVICAAPEDREEFGPTYTPSWGEEWDAQPDAGDEDPADPGWGLAVDDFDGDDVYEILLANAYGTRLYVWDEGASGFLDRSAERLPDLSGYAVRSASAADLEGDGDLDLYLGVDDGTDRLLRNDGGIFTDITREAGLTDESWTAIGSTWGDVDGDGDLELFVANAFTFESGAPTGDGDSNAFYINNGDGTLTDARDLLPASAQEGFTTVAALIDLDDDVDPDLYLVNDFGWMESANALLYTSDGAIKTAASGSGLDLGVAGMGLGLGDLNGDRIPDLLVSSWSQLLLLESADGVWTDTTRARGIVPDESAGSVVAWGNTLADFDNDGDLDAFVGYGAGPPRDDVDNPAEQPDELWIQEEDGTFTQQADTWKLADPGMQRGLAVADIDGDGWLDLITRKLRGSTRVHMSQCGTAGWLRVTLRQPGANPYAVGARVIVEDSGREQVRWITAGAAGLSSSSPLEAHFGFGEVDLIDAITVRWPDGRESRVEGVDTRQQLRITRTE